jgi:hypothetical protein
MPRLTRHCENGPRSNSESGGEMTCGYTLAEFKLCVREPRVISDGVATSSEAFIVFSNQVPQWFRRQVVKGLEKGWMEIKVARVEKLK